MNTQEISSRIATAHDFLGIPLRVPTLDQFCDDLIRFAQDREQPRLVTYINAHCVNQYFGYQKYAEILRGADYVYADGMAVVKAARRFGIDVPQRLSAADFFEDCCGRFAGAGVTLYFLGAKRHQLRVTAEKLRAKYPALKILGHRHGYFDFGLQEEQEILREIQHFNPDVVVVGMGVPRQEEWVARVRGKLGVPLFWCVGALFEYTSGDRLRAPRWMGEHGLEWFFRLALEPGRLWKRYLIGNLIFKFHVRRALKRRARGGT